VATRWGDAGRRGVGFGPGAALVAPGDSGDAWLYLARGTERGLGSALVWADRHGAERLHILVDASPPGAAVLAARQASYFASPEVSVWEIHGRELVPAEPAPLPPPRQPEPAPDLLGILVEAGAEVVVEDGVVRGEVNGLEVARIVHHRSTAGIPLDRPRLEVGVGAADRELTAMFHGELPPADQLDRVVAIVRERRQAGRPHHPLNQLAPERWLRAALCRNPGALGLRALEPASGPRPRANLRERNVAVARGETAGTDPRPVVVACSVGIDVDLVPTAADARAALDPGAELWLAVPARDDHATTRRLASRLRAPARIVPVPDGWRSTL
jgi:hypothetical protein